MLQPTPGGAIANTEGQLLSQKDNEALRRKERADQLQRVLNKSKPDSSQKESASISPKSGNPEKKWLSKKMRSSTGKRAEHQDCCFKKAKVIIYVMQVSPSSGVDIV